MTKKLTWEVDKTSLVLKVSDGAKETTWKVRKNQGSMVWIKIFSEVLNSLEDFTPQVWDDIPPTKPMIESVRTVDAEELAELQGYRTIQADSEEASRAAQAHEVAKLTRTAKWFDVDEDDSYGMPIPDFDSGEIQ